MQETSIVDVLNVARDIIVPLGLGLIGYFQYRAKQQATKTAAVTKTAVTAAENAVSTVTATADTVKATMDKAVETIERVDTTTKKIKDQTDGQYTAMQKILKAKSDELDARSEELKNEVKKVADLTLALQKARDEPPRG